MRSILRDELDAAQKRIAELERKLEVTEILADTLGNPIKSPFCEHSSMYSYSEDGGKQIRCLLCSERDLRAKLAAAEQREREREEADAAVCPEDVGPHELIAVLRKQLAAAERERDEWRKKTLDCEHHPVVVALIAERDETLRVRDLAKEASNRDLEAKRAAEAEAKRLREALERVWAAVWDSYYGHGLSVECARSVDAEIRAALAAPAGEVPDGK